MFNGTANCWNPTWPIEVTREPRMHVAQFGDGYEQRTLDGINAMKTEWSLDWPMRPRDVLVAMDAYLAARLGRAFPFLDPISRALVNVFCDQWKLTFNYHGNSGDYGDMEATFRIANGAGII